MFHEYFLLLFLEIKYTYKIRTKKQKKEQIHVYAAEIDISYIVKQCQNFKYKCQCHLFLQEKHARFISYFLLFDSTMVCN